MDIDLRNAFAHVCTGLSFMQDSDCAMTCQGADVRFSRQRPRTRCGAGACFSIFATVLVSSPSCKRHKYWKIGQSISWYQVKISQAIQVFESQRFSAAKQRIIGQKSWRLSSEDRHNEVWILQMSSGATENELATARPEEASILLIPLLGKWVLCRVVSCCVVVGQYLSPMELPELSSFVSKTNVPTPSVRWELKQFWSKHRLSEKLHQVQDSPYGQAVFVGPALVWKSNY